MSLALMQMCVCVCAQITLTYGARAIGPVLNVAIGITVAIEARPKHGEDIYLASSRNSSIQREMRYCNKRPGAKRDRE